MLMILQIALGIVLAVAILANYQRIIVVGRKAAIGLGALMAVAAVGFGLYMAFEVVKDRQRLSTEAATPNSASKIARVEMPDGRVARFEVPEGTTPEQAQSMIEAQLPDGTILEFPAGTSNDVIQRAVKQQLGIKAESTPSAGKEAIFEERFAREQASKETGLKPWEKYARAAREADAAPAKPGIDPSQIIWDDEPKEQAKPGD